MGIAKSFSAQLIGLELKTIVIEVDISKGLHSFSIVGLGDRSIEEARDRISAAIKNSGFVSPKQKNQKVTISLAPADIRKEGPSFDLGMTLTYLLASEDIFFQSDKIIFLGELSLEGKLRKVSGILPILSQASSHGFEQAFIPKENAKEASLARGITIYPAESLNEVISHITNEKKILPLNIGTLSDINFPQPYDFCMVRGNEGAKRGLEISASGAHNVVMFGPPGTGKTLLAKCFSSILPDLSYEESVEVTGIHSIANKLNYGFITRPPFRSPHHTASYPSIVGGGAFPRPGEISLAHRGVLFLDEFPEFNHEVIEALRQPLEENLITISRARGVVTFPAQCIFIASLNPCPCGGNQCTCSAEKIKKYQSKISGPISDRIDIWLQVNKIDYKSLGQEKYNAENSKQIRDRIILSRKIQSERFAKNGMNKKFNSEMNVSDIEKLITMTERARQTLITSAERLNLSGRAFHRIQKIARTIADLEQKEKIEENHILESIQYREKRINLNYT